MRLVNWQISLVRYIDEMRNVPFCWGSHDCFTFINGAHTAIMGYGFADDIAGKSSTHVEARRQIAILMRVGDHTSPPDWMDTRLTRFCGSPRRGYIVGRKEEGSGIGYGLGICIGRKVAFVGVERLSFGPFEPDDFIWMVE